MDQDLENKLKLLHANRKEEENANESDEDSKMASEETMQDDEEAVRNEIQANKDMLNSLFAQVGLSSILVVIHLIYVAKSLL